MIDAKIKDVLTANGYIIEPSCQKGFFWMSEIDAGIDQPTEQLAWGDAWKNATKCAHKFYDIKDRRQWDVMTKDEQREFVARALAESRAARSQKKEATRPSLSAA